MPRSCTLCTHASREEIDHSIIAGQPYRDIAGRWAVSKSAVERHAGEHLAAAIARASEITDAMTADRLIAELRTLREVTLGVLEEARTGADHGMALKAIARLERQAELIGRLAGELIERREIEQTSVILNEEWPKMRSAIVDALQPYPEAWAAVLAKLNGHEFGI